MDRRIFIAMVSTIVFFVSSVMMKCARNEAETQMIKTLMTDILTAEIETEAVNAGQDEDAADDPALWINFNDPSKSLIIGTNKKAGLNLYRLDGTEVWFYPGGLLNNVDVRYGFDMNGLVVDICGASNRTSNTISLFVIDGESMKVIPANASELRSGVDEVYGFCLYHSQVSGIFYAFVNGKNGKIEQWKLFSTGENTIQAELIRTLSVDSQPEGMVADDQTGILYVGEEERGIWKFQAEPGMGNEKKFIAMSGEDNPEIEFDIEGLAIYHQPRGKGYLIASSQGNNSYAVFSREGDNEYIRSFTIDAGVFDGAEETDGLEVSNYGLNEIFPGGILIVQDGFNMDGDSLTSQNFKLLDWRKVAYLINPEMKMDAAYNPYKK